MTKLVAYCKSCKYYIPDDATLCAHCGTDQRMRVFFWKCIAAITNFLTIGVAIAIFSQSVNLNRQTDIIRRSFELENRPYLYVDISPVTLSVREKAEDGHEYDNLFVGADLKYKNVGKLPACNIKSEIHFYSDVDIGDNFERLKKWFIDNYGHFPEPTSIFPNQEGQLIPCRVDCSEATKKYLFTIRITYTGEDPNKVYWYSTDVRYSIEKGYFKQEQKFIREGDKIIQVPGRKEYDVYLLEVNSDYDRDGKVDMPKPLSRPY